MLEFLTVIISSRAIHVVSQVHSLIIVAGALYAVWTETPDRALDKAFGWSETTGFVHGIAVGYFLWDSLDAIVNYVDFGFIVHGVACTLVYGLSYVSPPNAVVTSRGRLIVL